MTKGARNILPGTIKRLYALSGNQCAFPGCKVTFVNPDDDTNISIICHIEAANPGGPRYNPNSTDDYRRSDENLILLCPNHHVETDNVSLYPVEVLQDMKRKHVDKIRTLLSEQNILINYPSALNKVIILLGKTFTETTESIEPKNAPNLEQKISYNNVIRYKPVIQSYSAYQGKINRIYVEIERQGSSLKEILLRNINTLYLKEKGKYPTFDEVKANADNIIESIEKKLWEIVDDSSNELNIEYESISISLLTILVDAFMRCNILEEPAKP